MQIQEKKEKKQPPIWLILIIIFAIFCLIPFGFTLIFNLPLFLLPFPQFWAIAIGAVFLID